MTTRHIIAFGGAGLGATDARRPLLSHVLSLTGKAEPRVCYVGTAMGDLPLPPMQFYDITREVPCRASHLSLFPMPNVPDIRDFVLSQDVVYVGGGSVANLLAVWRVHGLDAILREAWQAGVVMCGTSAGSLCWFEGGTTDSFGPALQLVTGGLGLIAASNCPHYDSEPQRRPLYQSMVASGALSAGWAADDHVGLHFVDDVFHEAIAARPDARAWRVERNPSGDSAVESEIIPRMV